MIILMTGVISPLMVLLLVSTVGGSFQSTELPILFK